MTVEELVSRAAFLELPAIALTDHWSTYGHCEFFRRATERGIKPILGAEIRHASLTGSGGIYHLTVLAENETGYANLASLITRHSMKDKEPFVTIEEMSEFHEGLIALTGCWRGEAAQSVSHGTLGRARGAIGRLVELYGRGNVFAELMNHNIEGEELVVDQLAIIAGRLGVQTVATNNDKYLTKDDAANYAVLRSLGKHDPNSLPLGDNAEFHLKRERELVPYFSAASGLFERAGEIAERCRVDLDRRGRIRFSSAANSDDVLKNMCGRRFVLKFHDRPRDERRYLKGILERELEAARSQDVCDFIVFVRELFLEASKRGMWLEVVGSDLLDSLLAYVLGIVPLNPLEHDLVFESFTPRAGLPPAVELIASEDRKGAFIELLESLLPGYRASFQVTEEEVSLATIVREVGARSEAPQELRDRINREIAFDRRRHSIAGLIEDSDVLMHLYSAEPVVKRILQSAEALRGKILHMTLNTSRVVVVPLALERFVSYTCGENDDRFAQLSTDAIEGMGGWIAGVQHSHFFSALARAVEKMRSAQDAGAAGDLFAGGTNGTWAPETLDDPAAYNLISAGETAGVYLLESQGIRDHLTRAKPATFGELVNVISLYRPGPMEGGLWERYLANAEKKGKVFLPHASLAPALEGTRAVLLYREQVREILEQTGGLKGAAALGVEEALRSRDPGELMSARLSYIRGAMEAGIDEEDAQKIFDFLLHSVAYTQLKAQSVAQAYLSYRTAFLKAHAFEPYFEALLTSNIDVAEREKRYLEYLASHGVALLPPDINGRIDEYSYEAGGLRAPLRKLAFLERPVREAISSERETRGPFLSLEDFIERMAGKADAEVVLDLAAQGAFDFTGLTRGELGARANRTILERMGRGPVAPAQTRRPAKAGQKCATPGTGVDEGRQMSLFDSTSGDADSAGGRR